MAPGIAAPSVAEVLAAAVATLSSAGVTEGRADAEVLLAHAMGIARGGLVARAHDHLDSGAATRFEELVEARRRRVPVWHLIGRREFWSLDVAVDARVLTPRPETELLVEVAITLTPPGGTVVDAGTGSGAVACAVARERPDARVLAIDVDPAALVVAHMNTHRLAPRVGLLRAQWLSACASGSIDLVVANPPYVPDAVVSGLAPEVRDHEPRGALAGGADGLREIRRVVAEAARVLRAGGRLAIEVGAGQAAAVCALVEGGGWERGPEVRLDLAGLERVVVARRRASWT